MTAVIAIGAVSGLGRGEQAYVAGPAGEPAPSAIREDPELAAAGLTRPLLARAPAASVARSDRATELLADALAQVCAELDDVLPGWRERKLGICIGTSSGGMLSAERFFRGRAAGETPSRQDAVRATYYAPFDEALAAHGLAPAKRCQVVAACASSTIAIGLGMRWLDRGAAELVLAGGYDGVSLFVAAGFEALRATSTGMPQPFRVGRDGMHLGEGAGVIAMVRDAPRVHFHVTGFGTSADAVHITAPDRDGGGLIRAGRAALADADCDPRRIDLVSAHGTATPYNDAAEAKAIHALCGDPLVHPFKAQIGHTLGAAGVLELLSAAHAIRQGLAPAAYGDGPIDPEATVALLPRAEPRAMDAALKLSAAFGGVSAALVAETRPRTRKLGPSRTAGVIASAHVPAVDRASLAQATGIPRDRLARIDELGLLGLAAVAALVGKVGKDGIAGAGVIAGYGLATLDTNEQFNHRLIAKGPRWVDPRLFPATSPNAGAGHVAIAFGLTGPNFAVNGGLGGALEALAAAAELIVAGDADKIIVVSADDDGPAARAWHDIVTPDRPHEKGAVALLVGVGEGTPIEPDSPVDHDRAPVGHLALMRFQALATP